MAKRDWSRGAAAVVLQFVLAVESAALEDPAATDAAAAPRAEALTIQGQQHYSQREFHAAHQQLSRALQLIRRDGGLNDPRQYPVLEMLFDIDGRMGRTGVAAGHLKYLERIGETAYGAQSARHVQTLTTVGDGFCRLGDFFAGRQRHRAAMAIVQDDPRSDDVQRVQVLLGLARCALHELSPQGVTTLAAPLEEYRGPIVRSARADPGDLTFRYHTLKQLNFEAESALTRAAAVANDSDSVPVELQVATLLQAGDWFQIKDHTDRARGYYIEALRASAAKQMAGADTVLASPVRILYAVPAIALPPQAVGAERFVVVSFSVASNGTTQNEEVLKRDASKSMVDETLAALRSARYRPRFVGDRPVITEHVQFEQTFGQIR